MTIYFSSNWEQRGRMDLDRMLKEGKEDYFIMAETLNEHLSHLLSLNNVM